MRDPGSRSRGGKLSEVFVIVKLLLTTISKPRFYTSNITQVLECNALQVVYALVQESVVERLQRCSKKGI